MRVSRGLLGVYFSVTSSTAMGTLSPSCLSRIFIPGKTKKQKNAKEKQNKRLFGGISFPKCNRTGASTNDKGIDRHGARPTTVVYLTKYIETGEVQTGCMLGLYTNCTSVFVAICFQTTH